MKERNVSKVKYYENVLSTGAQLQDLFCIIEYNIDDKDYFSENKRNNGYPFFETTHSVLKELDKLNKDKEVNLITVYIISDDEYRNLKGFWDLEGYMDLKEIQRKDHVVLRYETSKQVDPFLCVSDKLSKIINNSLGSKLKM